MYSEMSKIRREVEEFKSGKKSLLKAMDAIQEILTPQRDVGIEGEDHSYFDLDQRSDLFQ